MQYSAGRRTPWRDPLSMGWQAHRRILLLRLRWHSSATNRRDGGIMRSHGR